MYRKILLGVIVVMMAISTMAQVAPQAKVPSIPITVGVGYSNYNTDWSGRLSGPSLWIDWSIDRGPSYLKGLGVEVEARDLNYERTTPNLRMDTAAGGVIYTMGHLRNINPYGKFLVGYGSVDFTLPNYPNYKHDTRTVLAPALGADFRVFQGLVVRANYEYQFWPDFFHYHALNPNGITVGVAYDMGGHRTQ